jgi:homoserine dehydrogenase
MKEIETLSLIDGQFSDEEANDILMNVFLKKITFHERKDFSAIEMHGASDKNEKDRIITLKKEMEKAHKIIAEAKSKNQRLRINSEIKISLLTD